MKNVVCIEHTSDSGQCST